MEPATIEIVLSVLAVINIAFLSIIKVVFTYAVNFELQLKHPADRRCAKKIQRIFEDRPFFTAIISIGKTITSSLLTIMVYRILATCIEPLVLPVVTIVVVALLISFTAYTIPKALATANSERYLRFSFLFYQLNLLFAPIALLMGLVYKQILHVNKFDEKYSFLSEEEKERFNGDSELGEMLDQEEQAMIRNIFEFGETTVREIMVPRIDMTSLNIEASFGEVLSKIYEESHSRIPIYTENIDTIVGILYTKDILRWISTTNGNFNPNDFNMREIMKKPYFVPLNKKLDDLMTDMKANQSHIVVVVDEYGGTAGICSLEDVLEEIVGEIRDEYDEHESEEFNQIDPHTFLVNPHMELDTLEEKLNIKLDCAETEYSTVGGLFYHEFGDVPDEGTTFDFQGMNMTITKMDHQRIEEIRIAIDEPEPAIREV